MGKLAFKWAVKLEILMLSLGVLVHVGVILGWIPYTWVNGGRSPSETIGIRTSVISIPIILAIILFYLWASQIDENRLSSGTRRIRIFILWFLVFISMIGVIQQLLGTPFERFVMTPVLFISLFCSIYIARSCQKSKWNGRQVQ